MCCNVALLADGKTFVLGDVVDVTQGDDVEETFNDIKGVSIIIIQCNLSSENPLNKGYLSLGDTFLWRVLVKNIKNFISCFFRVLCY